MFVSDTVPALLHEAAETYPDATALVEGDMIVTYADLEALAHDVGRALLGHGVGPGDRVAVWSPNSIDFVVTLLGAQSVGASLVPLNTRYKGEEARTILRRAGARAIFVAGGFLGLDYLGMLGDVLDDAELQVRVVVDYGAAESGPRAVCWPDFLEAGRSVPTDELDRAMCGVTPETIADILFTSGTTGQPKGVMSSHRQTVGVARQWAIGARMTMRDRYAVVNPMFHSFGYKAGVMAALVAGASVHPVAVFDAEALMTLIEKARISVLPGPPTIFITLLHHPRRRDFDLSSLRFATAGSTAVAENLFEQMCHELGFDTVAQAYGLTECVLVTQSRPDESVDHVAETTGPAVPGMEIRLGAHDEVLVRGPFVMRGYFDDPDATAEAIDSDGWLHTGDVGRIDEHGCLTLTDRLKDVVIVGGFNVYPVEVENVLARHPAVAESAVVGVADGRLGSVVRAWVVPKPGMVVQPAELIDHVRERLANFKVPRSVVIVEDLPRNAAGKILKRDLRA